jgi:hypothetical protein
MHGLRTVTIPPRKAIKSIKVHLQGNVGFQRDWPPRKSPRPRPSAAAAQPSRNTLARGTISATLNQALADPGLAARKLETAFGICVQTLGGRSTGVTGRTGQNKQQRGETGVEFFHDDVLGMVEKPDVQQNSTAVAAGARDFPILQDLGFVLGVEVSHTRFDDFAELSRGLFEGHDLLDVQMAWRALCGGLDFGTGRQRAQVQRCEKTGGGDEFRAHD